MNNVKFNSLSISERRQNEIRDARISLVKESRSRDEQIQNEIRKKYSLSEEVAILRKEVSELKTVLTELLQIEALDSENSTEFDTYNKYVEECKAKIKTETTEEGEVYEQRFEND